MRERSGRTEGVLSLAVALLVCAALALVFLAKWHGAPPDGTLNVNTGSAADLQRALGISRDAADAILARRARLGSFGGVDQVAGEPASRRAGERENGGTGEQGNRRAGEQATHTSDQTDPSDRSDRSHLNTEHPPPSAQHRTPEHLNTRVPEYRTSPSPAPSLTTAQLSRLTVRSAGSIAKTFWLGATALTLTILLLPAWLRARGTGGDPFLLPLALLLAGLGVAMLFSIKDPFRDRAVYAHHLLGLAPALAVMLLCARLRPFARQRIRSYQYVWVFLAVGLAGALFLFGRGPEGVKLDLFHFQPVEIIKLMLVFFVASYLADRADLIADTSRPYGPRSSRAHTDNKPLPAEPDSSPPAPGSGATSETAAANLDPDAAIPSVTPQPAVATRQPAVRLPAVLTAGLPRLQDVGPVAVMFGWALLLFFFVKDLGPGLLMFATFVAMLYMATGRSGFVAAGVALILLGGVIGYAAHVGVFPTRVDMWLHPFHNAHPNGMQLAESYWAIGSGGAEGSGLGMGMPGLLPRSGSDLAFTSWAEETGAIGALFVLTIYAVLVWRGLRIALRAPNDFDRMLALGLSTLLGLQTLLIVGGVTGAFPLTGISLPFLSYGNSALVADFAIIGLLRGISASTSSGRTQSLAPERMERAVPIFATVFTLALLGWIGIARVAATQLVTADAVAVRPVITPDADHVSRPHLNPRLLALARAIPRGTIYDRNGRPLATSRPAEIEAAAGASAATRIEASGRRYYPFGPATAHLVGYLDPAVGGPYGLERTYDTVLRGYAHETDLLADFRNRNLPFYHARFGRDLRLTIDGQLQRMAQDALLQVEGRLKDSVTHRAKDRGAFVLLDPATGNVLAAASTPAFDPNYLTPESYHTLVSGAHAQEEHPLIDRALLGLYPPGSTLKVATAAAALDNLPGAMQFEVACNRVCPEIRWEAGGRSYVRRNIRDDVGDPAFGLLTLAPAFRVSSNIYFANLAVRIGADTFRRTLADKLGFRHAPAEAAFNADLPDIGYGQGRMLASPLAMARLAATVADGGLRVEPSVVAAITDPNAQPKSAAATGDPAAQQPAMTPATAEALQKLMRTVVTGGTARGVFERLSAPVAGKTGTAQNHQADRQPHSWFIGFAPYGAPKYAFACVVENGGYGKRVAAVVCREVLGRLLGP